MTVEVYVESDVGAHIDNATVAWLFDLDYWGRCGQGHDEASALAALRATPVEPAALRVVERISGDERAFQRDRQPATPAEVTRTLAILHRERGQTLGLIASASIAELDWDDPERVLPPWALWRTLSQMAWHIADTESRYYLPQLGLPALPRGTNLREELRQSHDYVREILTQIGPDLYRITATGEVWTTVKVLRRLAWHERSELITMRRLLKQARIALAT